MALRLRIVTPERQLLDQDVEEVTAPGISGEIGVLPDHITFLTMLAPGRLAYTSGGKREVVAIFGGYAEVADNVMTVLADGAEPVSEIDAEVAKRAADDAEKALGDLDPTSPEALAALRALGQARARVAAASDNS